MNIDPLQIRTEVDAVLADLAAPADIEEIDAVGRRLEQAHQILVHALESVEKG